MGVQFVASIAPIVRDPEAARAFYRDALGLSFEGNEGEYMFTQNLDGTRHFGLWPLSEAATGPCRVRPRSSKLPRWHSTGSGRWLGSLCAGRSNQTA